MALTVRNFAQIQSDNPKLAELLQDIVTGINNNANTHLNVVENEVPSGTIDGVNRSFALKSTPNPPTSVVLFKQQLRQILGTDFTVNGNRIVYAVAPALNDKHVCDYRA